jgi:hypothetical protein
MAAMSFDQIWEAVKNLSPQQQGRLRKLLDTLRFHSRPLTPEDEAELMLLKEGVIRRIPRPSTEAGLKAFRESQPVEVQGKPLSETVIEERR